MAMENIIVGSVLSILIIFVGSVMFILVGILYQLRELHLSLNSRLTELLLVTKTLARAEGFRAGQENHLRALRDFKDAE